MSGWRTNLALLLLRVYGALLAIAHGWPKLASFSERMGRFVDPLHVGPTASLVLTIFGELVCGLLLALGVFTRFSAIPPLITMIVAALLVHSGDPFSDRELATVYAIPFAALALLGGGEWSLDRLIRRRKG